MTANLEHLRQSMEYYQTSSRGNVISSRLSQVLAVGFGVLAGLGVSMVVDGHTVGVAAAGVGGYLSWRCAGQAGEEANWAVEDSVMATEYETRVAKLLDPTSGLE